MYSNIIYFAQGYFDVETHGLTLDTVFVVKPFAI